LYIPITSGEQMKVKIFGGVNSKVLEEQVNAFIADKKVIDVKLTPGAAESEAMHVLVMWEEN
jgi:hypothetical protein